MSISSQKMRRKQFIRCSFVFLCMCSLGAILCVDVAGGDGRQCAGSGPGDRTTSGADCGLARQCPARASQSRATSILTAGHCAAPDAEYKFVTFDNGGNHRYRYCVRARHPQFDLKVFLNHRATADVALMKTAGVAAGGVRAGTHRHAAAISPSGRRFLVAGYGLAIPGDGRTGGKARQAKTHRYGPARPTADPPGRSFNQQYTRRDSAAAPAISGAPAFRHKQRRACCHRTCELDHRRTQRRRLRRPYRHYTTDALSRVDRRHGSETWQRVAVSKTLSARQKRETACSGLPHSTKHRHAATLCAYAPQVRIPAAQWQIAAASLARRLRQHRPQRQALRLRFECFPAIAGSERNMLEPPTGVHQLFKPLCNSQRSFPR